MIGFDLLQSHVGRNVGDEAPTKIRDIERTRSGGHDHFIGRNRGILHVLGKWPLVQTIKHLRTGAKVIPVPVVRRHGSERTCDRAAGRTRHA